MPDSNHESWNVLSLQTSNSTTQVMFGVSIPILLIVGWVTAVVLVAIGYQKHNGVLVRSGIVGLGLMTMATPLSYYLSEAFRLATFEARPSDFLLLSLFAFLGGIITGYGITRGMRKSP